MYYGRFFHILGWTLLGWMYMYLLLTCILYPPIVSKIGETSERYRWDEGPPTPIVGQICERGVHFVKKSWKFARVFFLVCWFQKLREPRHHCSGSTRKIKNLKWPPRISLISITLLLIVWLHWFWCLNPYLGGQGIHWNIRKLNMLSSRYQNFTLLLKLG